MMAFFWEVGRQPSRREVLHITQMNGRTSTTSRRTDVGSVSRAQVLAGEDVKTRRTSSADTFKLSSAMLCKRRWRRILGDQSACQFWSSQFQPFSRYWEGIKIPKVGHVIPSRPPLTYFCIFFGSSLVVNLLAKFEVSTSNRSRDMEGVPKFQK